MNSPTLGLADGRDEDEVLLMLLQLPLEELLGMIFARLARYSSNVSLLLPPGILSLRSAIGGDIISAPNVSCPRFSLASSLILVCASSNVLLASRSAGNSGVNVPFERVVLDVSFPGSEGSSSMSMWVIGGRTFLSVSLLDARDDDVTT